MLGQTSGRNGQNGYNGTGGNGKHKITSLIGPGIAYRGTLSGEAGIRIDGTFDGRINIMGPLVISDTGKVTAEEIRAAVVSVAGSVRGNIIARQVEILSGGRVWGDVVTAAFASEEGAFLRGQVKMLDELPA
ncbi:MAG: polymer-forming cytoskeletal protein [Chloroflexi bacterium]|nr:polymer-forming cytoskeletal protein [Chloroflexota bacterium]